VKVSPSLRFESLSQLSRRRLTKFRRTKIDPTFRQSDDPTKIDPTKIDPTIRQSDNPPASIHDPLLRGPIHTFHQNIDSIQSIIFALPFLNFFSRSFFLSIYFGVTLMYIRTADHSARMYAALIVSSLCFDLMKCSFEKNDRKERLFFYPASFFRCNEILFFLSPYSAFRES
jgi:ABC-type multidrug transport system permease subunit